MSLVSYFSVFNQWCAVTMVTAVSIFRCVWLPWLQLSPSFAVYGYHGYSRSDSGAFHWVSNIQTKIQSLLSTLILDQHERYWKSVHLIFLFSFRGWLCSTHDLDLKNSDYLKWKVQRDVESDGKENNCCCHINAVFHVLFVAFLCFPRRRFLYVVNLEAPSEPPRKIGRQSKWDVGTVQWNPHKSESHVFAASVSSAVNCD